MTLVTKMPVALALFALPAMALAAAPAAPAAAPKVALAAPAAVAADPANQLTLQLSNGGTVVVQLRPDVAPRHVYRIQQLASSGFYDGVVFHRVIPGFMAQGGDPTGTGEGGSPLPDLKQEFNDLPHLRGTMAMARSQSEDSANSQFFIMLSPNFKLDHRYTAFGRVLSGMATVDGIAVGEPPAAPTKIVRASIGGPLPAPPAGYESAVVAPVAPAAPAAPVETAPVPAPAASDVTDANGAPAPVAPDAAPPQGEAEASAPQD